VDVEVSEMIGELVAELVLDVAVLIEAVASVEVVNVSQAG